MTSGTISSGSTSTGPSGYFRTWTGIDGKKETVSGKLRTKWNQYNLTHIEQTSVVGSAGFYFISPSVGQFSDYFTASDAVGLQSKLVSKVRGHDFNLAVNIATGKQTVDMVVDNLRKFGRAMLALRRGDFANAARQLGAAPRTSKLKPKDIAGRWLELQYGWLPSLSDTFEACKAFEKLTNDARQSTVRVSKTISKLRDGSQSPPNWSSLGPVKARRTIEFEMMESIGASRSLGLVDPLSVIWEIIPYSFVVDWFLPIGSYLDNLSIIPTLLGRFCTSDLYCYQSTSKPTVFGQSHDFPDCSMRYKYLTFNRIISESIPVAFPSFVPLPEAMSPRRIYNAIALTAQIFLKKR